MVLFLGKTIQFLVVIIRNMIVPKRHLFTDLICYLCQIIIIHFTEKKRKKKRNKQFLPSVSQELWKLWKNELYLFCSDVRI